MQALRRRWLPKIVIASAALVGLVILFGVATIAADRFVAPPRVVPADRALPVQSPVGPLRITILGTSLTARYDWPDRLRLALGQCLGEPPEVTVIAMPGAASDWGVGQVGPILASSPDIVLVEFATNDADLRHWISLHESEDLHRRLIADLRAGKPDIRIALMTMSPAQGLRAMLRPRLARYYAQYLDLADELDLGLVDIYPLWTAVPRAERGLEADGLHPDADVAAAIILPAVVPFLALATGAECPAGM
jgi:lysophospholipase L1-like esterase